METVSVNLDIASEGHVTACDPCHVVVYVFVLSSLKEFATDDTGVLLVRLVDANAIIREVEGDDEATVDVLWHTGVETSRESQDFLVVIDFFEEVRLGSVRH